MSKILCFLLPSLISMEIEEKFLKPKTNTKWFWIKYGIYCLCNNVVTIALSRYILNIKSNVEESIMLYPGVMVKYALIAIVVATVLSFAKIVIQKNIEVRLEEKSN